MIVIRDIMYCKPGKARPMVDKFLKLSKLSQKLGISGLRVMTDVSAERYWTVVAEFEVPNLEAYSDMSRKSMEHPEFKDIMQGYHDLLDHGRREIYTVEG